MMALSLPQLYTTRCVCVCVCQSTGVYVGMIDQQTSAVNKASRI